MGDRASMLQLQWKTLSQKDKQSDKTQFSTFSAHACASCTQTGDTERARVRERGERGREKEKVMKIYILKS